MRSRNKPGTEAHDTDIPSLRCEDCAILPEHYMVRNEVWALAWPDYEEERMRRRRQWRHDGTGSFFCLLCFACLEKRLGRKLTANDFNLELPINKPIAFGMRLAQP